ncbi:MAG TPA: hypothetical protein PLN21_04665 [Gemmatales bacterium]|nr:hypothetical protein [Gemmatales bacterium]
MNNFKHWHLLDARAVWVKEFAGALSREVDLQNWLPEISWTGYFKDTGKTSKHDNPPLSLNHFSLQRGFAKWPFRLVCDEGKRIAKRLRKKTIDESKTVLLCISPQYAAVAEAWKGPVIYWMTDLYCAYGDDPAFITACDRRICHRANLVCPISERCKDYLVEKAHCALEKIAISQTATRSSNILASPLLHPGDLPADIADLPRPIIGVIGNLAANMDWLFLHSAIKKLPGYSWVFVGPTDMNIPDTAYRQARAELQAKGGSVRFVGYKPYHQLAGYAQCFDVALLPYRKVEPTYSGSSTRFFEHLAACRPMYATDGFAMLLSKEPLVHLVYDVDSFVKQVKELSNKGFMDGVEMDRWKASHSETWEARATAMREEIGRRMS